MRNPLEEFAHRMISEAEQRMPRVSPEVPEVVVIECPICRGSGKIETDIDPYTGIGWRWCAHCAGRGFVATEGGEP